MKNVVLIGVKLFAICAVAALTLGGINAITEPVIIQRKIMELQQGISWRMNRGMIGSVMPVLVDCVSAKPGTAMQGRTSFQAPEVDGVVYINDGIACSGKIVRVKITEAGPYDLVGEVEVRA